MPRARATVVTARSLLTRVYSAGFRIWRIREIRRLSAGIPEGAKMTCTTLLESVGAEPPGNPPSKTIVTRLLAPAAVQLLSRSTSFASSSGSSSEISGNAAMRLCPSIKYCIRWTLSGTCCSWARGDGAIRRLTPKKRSAPIQEGKIGAEHVWRLRP